MQLRKPKFLKFFNKRNKKNRKKASGKKRGWFASLALAGNLLFGKYLTNDLKLTNYSNVTSLVREKVISNQKFTSLDDSHNSGEIIQTGNGTIFKFQHKGYDASSNEILSEHNLNKNDELILVKDNGLLPGVESFPTNNNYRRRHQFGKPRVTGSQQIDSYLPQNIEGIGNILDGPKGRSFREVDTELSARRGNRRDQCSASKVNMYEEHQKLIEDMKHKGYIVDDIDCSLDRFEKLSTNPETDLPDQKSVNEAKAIVQAEQEN